MSARDADFKVEVVGNTPSSQAASDAIGASTDAARYTDVPQSLMARVRALLNIAANVWNTSAAAIRGIPTDPSSGLQARVLNAPAQETDAGLVVRLARRGALTDRSSAIAQANVSQTLAAANTSRRYLLVQNPPSNSGRLWINFTTAAAQASPSVALDPGDSFFMEGQFVTTEAVNIIGPTAAQAYTAKEG